MCVHVLGSFFKWLVGPVLAGFLALFAYQGILSCEDVSRLSSVFRLLRLCCVAVFVLFLAKQRCWALGLVLSRMCLSPFAFQLPGFCSCLYLSHVQTVKNSLLVSSGFLGHFIFYV